MHSDREREADGPGMHAEIEQLRAQVARRPGSAAFPELAEAYRKAGRIEESLQVSAEGIEHSPRNIAGRVAAALSLMDLGDLETARRELEQALEISRTGTTQPLDAATRATTAAVFVSTDDEDFEDSEIDLAFESAESDRSQMMDANQVAEQAMRQIDLESSQSSGFAPADLPTFATATMAEVLERQGDEQGAHEIRAALGAPSGRPVALTMDAAMLDEQAARPEPADGSLSSGDDARARVLATLERWLENIRREVA